MKKFMDSIVDMDSPFSFCGGGGLADEELIGSTYFQEGAGIVVAPVVVTNFDINGDGDLWDEAAITTGLAAGYAGIIPGGQFAGAVLGLTAVSMEAIDRYVVQ